MPTKLGRSLEQARVPEAEPSPELLESASEPGRRRRVPALIVAAPALVGLVAVVALLVGLSSSESSRSTSSGSVAAPIGSSPSDPPINGGTATVVGIGETPGGEPYEVALNRKTSDGGKDPRLDCLYISYPNPALGPGFYGCLTRAELDALAKPGNVLVFATVGGKEFGASSGLLVTATAAPDVASARVVAEGVETAEMSRVSLAPPETEAELAYFVAYLPLRALGEPDVTTKPNATEPLEPRLPPRVPEYYPEVATAIDGISIIATTEDGTSITKPILESPFAASILSDALYERAKDSVELAPRLSVLLEERDDPQAAECAERVRNAPPESGGRPRSTRDILRYFGYCLDGETPPKAVPLPPVKP